MKITWLGQAGLLMETGGKIILIDPYLSDSVAKVNPLNYRRVPVEEQFLYIKPDVIICTHNHLDHVDPETLKYYLAGEGSVQKFMMPIIKKINNKRIQRLVPQFMKTVTDYISSVERTVEKYQYSRRYAWRKTCADGKPYDLDPLDFETEEEYNKAIQDAKYRWRRWHREASRYGLDVNSFETEEEYEKVLREKQAIERQERLAQRQASYIDPLASTDKAIYEFCGVSFGNHSHPYHYLTGGIDVSIGDQVEVPSNRPEGVSIGTVVSVSKHLRSSAPYPVDRAKTILRKI